MMTDPTFDELYKQAPAAQREQLREFRRTHPYRQLEVGGVQWEYIASGQGQQGLLVLGGGLSLGETSFRTILRLEERFYVISPSYPPLGKAGPVVDGLAAILEKEGLSSAHVFGHSLGSAVGHVLVRLHPERVDKLIIDAFGLYTPSHVRLARWFFRLPYGLLIAYYRRAMKRLLAKAGDDEQLFYAIYMDEVMNRLHTPATLIGQFKMLIDIFDQAEAYGVFRPVERPDKVLLILADDDRGFSAEERQALKDTYPGAQVHTFASGGHLAGFSRRDEFDAVVDRFLAS